MAENNNATETIMLGPLDHLASSNIPQSIIYLSLKDGTSPYEAFDCLREGLHRTLQQAPWLAGRVHYTPQDAPGWRPGQLEIRHASSPSAEGLLRFNEIDTPMSFADLRETGFPLDSFEDEQMLWTSPFEPDFEAGAAVLAAQANFVPGGCLLVVSVAPSASDGTAMLAVTKVWADHCAGLMEQHKAPAAPSLPFTTDRALLDTFLREEKAKQPSSGPDEKHLELSKLVGLVDAADTRGNGMLDDTRNGSRSHDMKPKVFYMSQSAYTTLRKECTEELGSAEISGNDLVCALIFRSLVRASIPDDGDRPKVATLAIPFDARPNLTQSLGALYLGNVNFENRLSIPTENLISPNTSIPWVARAIREHAENCAHPARLLEAYELARSTSKYDKSHIGLCAARMIPATASVGVLSPMSLPFNDTCFGKYVFENNGNPEGFRPLMGSCNSGYRTCFVVPRKKAGGIEFVMTLSEEDMDFLAEDDEFSRYAFSLT